MLFCRLLASITVLVALISSSSRASDLAEENRRLRQRVAELEAYVSVLEFSDNAPAIIGDKRIAIESTHRLRSMQPEKRDQFLSSVSYRHLQSYGHKFHSSAAMAGYKRTNGIWNFGATLSFEEGRENLHSFTNVRSSTSALGLFGGIRHHSGFYGQALLFYGRSNHRAKFTSTAGMGFPTSDIAASKIGRDFFGAGIEIGGEFGIGNYWTMRPHLGTLALIPDRNNYRFYQNGHLFAVLVRESKRHAIEVPLGVHISREFFLGDSVLAPFVDATVFHALRSNTFGGISAHNGISWNAYGVGAEDLGGRFTAGASYKIKNIDLGLSYTYEARDGFDGHQASLAFSLGF